MNRDLLADLLNDVRKEIFELRRPRLLFDINPSKKHSFNLYDVTLRNVGGSPAYDNNSCTFSPDLPHGNTTLSELPIFRNLSHLAHNEIMRLPSSMIARSSFSMILT